jgi:hypothetical protein
VPQFDVHSLSLGGGKHLAIVEVHPIAIPPCFTHGTVYERVSGRTVPVKDPTQLADLYKRGIFALDSSRNAAADAATAVIEDPLLTVNEVDGPRLAVAVSATSHPPDIGSRLFSEDYEEAMIAIVKKHLIPPRNNLPDWIGKSLLTGFEQSNRYVNCEDMHTFATPRFWHVRVIWSGTVVVHNAMGAERVFAGHYAREIIDDAWIAATELLDALGGTGPTHTEFRIEGGMALLGSNGKPMPQIEMSRGPLDSPPEELLFASVERELRRATGERVHEVPQEATTDNGLKS